jgi:hypothetical protein
MDAPRATWRRAAPFRRQHAKRPRSHDDLERRRRKRVPVNLDRDRWLAADADPATPDAQRTAAHEPSIVRAATRQQLDSTHGATYRTFGAHHQQLEQPVGRVERDPGRD